jgi:hypothetical protein
MDANQRTDVIALGFRGTGGDGQTEAGGPAAGATPAPRIGPL